MDDHTSPVADDGPRERYTRNGPDGFGPVELVALVLGTGVAGRPALTIAAELLARYGSVAALARAPVGALARVPGVGPVRAVRVHAACALARHAGAASRARVSAPADAWRIFRPALAGLRVEELHAIYLDVRGGVLCHQVVSRGTDRVTCVDPRMVLRPALEVGATSLVMAHNHPSGDPEPSAEDIAVTRRMQAAAEVVGVRFLDHLVLGGERFVSLAERGEVSPVPAWIGALAG